jgi:hypothetical protein
MLLTSLPDHQTVDTLVIEQLLCVSNIYGLLARRFVTKVALSSWYVNINFSPYQHCPKSALLKDKHAL